MYNELVNGNYWYYLLEEGGAGIVRAKSSEEAERKVREAYTKHGLNDGESLFTEEIKIYEIYQMPYDDAPDVLEIYDM